MYSKNNEYPTSLPNRIRLSNGLTRTGGVYTEEELTDAGYKYVGDKPEYSDSQYVEWNKEEGTWEIKEKSEGQLQDEASTKWLVLKEKRDSLLKESDWTQLPDAFNGEYSAATILLWREYRRILRNIDESYINKEDDFWPTKPDQQRIIEKYNLLKQETFSLRRAKASRS